MQPVLVRVVHLEGDSATVQLPEGQEVTLPKSIFPNDLKLEESVSLVCIRGADILNEILRDEEGKS